MAVVSAADLDRIRTALDHAEKVLLGFKSGDTEALHKTNRDVVTAADLEIDAVLKEALLESGDGWLSEETADGAQRLDAERVWVVDPLDGTKEFVAGLPEWCVSIALVVDKQVVAAGITNPDAHFRALGAPGFGCWVNDEPAGVSTTASLADCHVLASRSEVIRGEWDQWRTTSLRIEPMGSVAYKLARVAAGLADATWTLVPKHEWDVAAGIGLIEAAGGWARTLEGKRPVFNQRPPWLSGLIASGPGLAACLTRDFVSKGQPPPSP
ncbi:3'(2'),5'-bisphosphate nucleotidase CysQ [soil metagenome]